HVPADLVAVERRLVVHDVAQHLLAREGVGDRLRHDVAVEAAARDRGVQFGGSVGGHGPSVSSADNVSSASPSLRTYHSPRRSFEETTLARALTAVSPWLPARTGSRSSSATSGRSSLSAARRRMRSCTAGTSTGSDPRY